MSDPAPERQKTKNGPKADDMEQTMKQTPIQALASLIEPVFRRPEFIQAAALCMRQGKAGPEVLMVSSLTTRRWILPKGWPMKNRTLAGTALQEAWEEAGVVGTAQESPVGFYTYQKVRKGGLPVSCRVEVFRVDVADLARDWPERKKRRRQWMSTAEAARLVEEAELGAMLGSL